MKILIDMQGAQSDNRLRGIGRYTRELAGALIRNKGENKIHLLLNGLFKESLKELKELFSGLIEKENIHIFYPSGPADYLCRDNQSRKKEGELLRKLYIKNLNPDLVLITNFFEGYEDNSILSLEPDLKNSSGNKIKNALIFYDLIPLIHPDNYLLSSAFKGFYKKKVKELKKADLLLSISESSKDEAVRYAALPPEKIINISSAADKDFKPLKLDEKEKRELKLKYKIEKKIILNVPGGFDFRKNFENLFSAISLLPERIKELYQLIIVSKADENHINHLNKLAKKKGLEKKDYLLTGYMEDKDLIKLYNMAELCIFPSLHEGFGLPALEAMSCGAAVITSDRTSLPEVTGRKEALFNPEDPYSIAEKIKEVLDNKDFRKKLQEDGLRQAENFSWDKTGIKAIKALESLKEKKEI